MLADNSCWAYALWACGESQCAGTALSDIRRFCISPSCPQLIVKELDEEAACFINPISVLKCCLLLRLQHLERLRSPVDFNAYRFVQPLYHLRSLSHKPESLQASYPQYVGSALIMLRCQVSMVSSVPIFEKLMARI